MDKMSRSERIGVMTKILLDQPNQIYTLNYFSELFGVAKSTISDDVMLLRRALDTFNLGTLETVVGAAGGVKYIPRPGGSRISDFIMMLCDRLSEPQRILPGGFLYMTDLLFMPHVAERVGEIMANKFYDTNPDFVITVETKGIPIALMTGKALNCPVVIARRDSQVTEGSVVTINYVSASSKRIRTMSLARRAVRQGQRALIIDDFMKGGGTAKGMIDLLGEFGVDIAGVGVMIATQQPEEKMVENYAALIDLKQVDENSRKVVLEPAAWVFNE
jgi:purine operon repressor